MNNLFTAEELAHLKFEVPESTRKLNRRFHRHVRTILRKLYDAIPPFELQIPCGIARRFAKLMYKRHLRKYTRLLCDLEILIDDLNVVIPISVVAPLGVMKPEVTEVMKGFYVCLMEIAQEVKELRRKDYLGAIDMKTIIAEFGVISTEVHDHVAASP
jgi:hypothetical protein